MARVAEQANGGLMKVLAAIAAAFFSIIVAMLGWWINAQAEAQREVTEMIRIEQNRNSNRLTAIETRLGRIEDDIGELRNK